MDTLQKLTADAHAGNPGAKEALFIELYGQLKAMAASLLHHERKGHTLQKTALVNEVWLLLQVSKNLDSASKAEFMAAAAKAMQRVLIDHARKRNAQKRGAGRQRVMLTDVEDSVPEQEVKLEALQEALDELARDYSRQHQVVTMKYLGGLSVKQIAVCLGVSERTVANDWDFARARLLIRLGLARQP